jgi:hypothetical protein
MNKKRRTFLTGKEERRKMKGKLKLKGSVHAILAK